MMSDQFRGSKVDKKQQQTQPTLQYVSQYDSYGYLPPTASQTQLNQSSAVRTGYHLSPNGINNYQTLNTTNFNTASRVKSQANRLVSSQVKNENIVKGQSRVSYVPYQKKVVEYQDRTYIEKVPVKRKVVRYQQRKVMETIPREVITQDFYAVEKRIQYYKEIVPQRKIEMVPVEKKIKRYEYVPVEKQIVHYPENVDLETAKGQSRLVLRNQGVEVKADAEFRPINPALIYNYSARPQSKYNPIGYVDQGQSRVFSNSPTFLPQSYSQQIPESDYVFYGQPSYSRTNSAQKLQMNRIFSPRQAQGESYIKQLSSIGKSQLKRPFELLQQSKARNQGNQGNYGHLQGISQQQSQHQQ